MQGSNPINDWKYNLIGTKKAKREEEENTLNDLSNTNLNIQSATTGGSGAIKSADID
jgi:hypothetical protein